VPANAWQSQRETLPTVGGAPTRAWQSKHEAMPSADSRVEAQAAEPLQFDEAAGESGATWNHQQQSAARRRLRTLDAELLSSSPQKGSNYAAATTSPGPLRSRADAAHFADVPSAGGSADGASAFRIGAMPPPGGASRVSILAPSKFGAGVTAAAAAAVLSGSPLKHADSRGAMATPRDLLPVTARSSSSNSMTGMGAAHKKSSEFHAF
jgi:hypothetical protein